MSEITDEVSMEIKCVYTEIKDGEIEKEELHDCAIIASAVDYGVFSIIDRESNIMLSISIENAIEMVKHTVQLAMDIEAMRSPECLENVTDATSAEEETN